MSFKTAIKTHQGKWTRASSRLHVLVALAITSLGFLITSNNDGALAEPKTVTTGKSDWIDLLAGGSLEQWMSIGGEAPDSLWEVSEGELTLLQGGGGDILTRRAFQNFELHLDWRISSGGNSGIFYRVANDGQPVWTSGPEYQILDDEFFPQLAGSTELRGSVFGLYAAKGSPKKPTSAFNTALIRVRGGEVQHWLNGTLVAQFDMHSDDWQRRVAASKFAVFPSFGRLKEGHIALQDHGNQVWYRNIRIREIE